MRPENRGVYVVCGVCGVFGMCGVCVACVGCVWRVWVSSVMNLSNKKAIKACNDIGREIASNLTRSHTPQYVVCVCVCAV